MKLETKKKIVSLIDSIEDKSLATQLLELTNEVQSDTDEYLAQITELAGDKETHELIVEENKRLVTEAFDMKRKLIGIDFTEPKPVETELESETEEIINLSDITL